MKIESWQIEQLEHFLTLVEQQTYPEPVSPTHQEITRTMIGKLIELDMLNNRSFVLDVGCGQGVALEIFKELGISAKGITLNHEDVSVCQQCGLDVEHMDQSFLRFPDQTFNLIWNRHCLEHSIHPYFTLFSQFRVLQPGGYLYLEVPAPDTGCKHQTNPNHYSVLGKSMWEQLIQRVGFELIEQIDINLDTKLGPDQYWAYFAKKPH